MLLRLSGKPEKKMHTHKIFYVHTLRRETILMDMCFRIITTISLFKEMYVLKNLFPCYLYYFTFLLKDKVFPNVVTKGTKQGS